MTSPSSQPRIDLIAANVLIMAGVKSINPVQLDCVETEIEKALAAAYQKGVEDGKKGI